MTEIKSERRDAAATADALAKRTAEQVRTSTAALTRDLDFDLEPLSFLTMLDALAEDAPACRRETER